MKKDDFKKSIDNINPDAYMGNRLKAKITADMPIRNNRRVTVSITAFCLAFAIIFGVAFLTPPTAPTEQTTTNNSGVENVKISPFIIVASAADVEGEEAVTENKVLELNEEYPYKMYLEIRDVSGLSDEEKYSMMIDSKDLFEKNLDNVDFYTGKLQTCKNENIVFVQYTFNDFKLDLENTENIKSINVKNTSKYGQMVHDYNFPKFGVPKHGNDITIDSKEYNLEKSSFYWDHTEEMEKAFNENINTPFSTFNDTITFTVEYNDGSKAIGVVELVFDDAGNAKVVCKNYDYVVQ